MVNQFRFYNAEKRFGHGIIPTVTLTAHALNEMMLFQDFSKICCKHTEHRDPNG